ncbi:FtsW/RodA/SpoVE family cell cycle protein [Clostridium oryzae]|uniref:Lipid II flippase FtsW n=1 Tax=Clostridium oryzae TaxID=1450648 RepID=A0A1V4IYZ3_9CLOT|nr:FtsW/RodA/SpoVE family cell cycle protein [Clostridium oryzae]OPJ65113.1 lipid II flippase FtsW [Clostridium oryzae]
MRTRRGEFKLLMLTYLLTIAVFGNLAILKQPIDTGAIIMGAIIFVLVTYAYFIIRKFFPDGDKFILQFAAIFSVIGIAMIYRLKPAYAIRQVIWFTIGVTMFVLIIVILPNIKSFVKYKRIYMIITLIFMAMATFIGRDVYGAKNWVFIGGFGFQPSEIGKLFFVAYLAAALKDYKDFKNLIEPALVVMATLGFMVLQRDLGSALLFFGISITMLYIATSKAKYIVVCIILFAIGAFVSYKLFGHVRVRVDIWLNPWEDPTKKGFQLVQSLIAIASGGFLGTGLGMGHPGFVPVADSDFIFAAICEEFGVFVGFGIMIFYFLLFYRCMRISLFVEDKFTQLLVVGYSAMIATQALVIIGGVVGAIPLTGITLPLISKGGSSMFSIFFALGILQKASEGE